jgi:hypothetical protein
MATEATSRRTAARKTAAKRQTSAKPETAAEPPTAAGRKTAASAETPTRPETDQPRAGAGERVEAEKPVPTAESQGMLARIPTPHVSVPHVALPQVSVPHVRRPSVRLPFTGRRGQVLWLGGLAVVAAFGVIDWPVAGAIAVGAYVAEQRSKAAKGQPNGQTPAEQRTESGGDRTAA